MKKGRKIKDLTGKRFGMWEVVNFSFIGKRTHRDAYWACICHGCGDVYDVRSDSLQSGHSTKCKKCAVYERTYEHAKTI